MRGPVPTKCSINDRRNSDPTPQQSVGITVIHEYALSVNRAHLRGLSLLFIKGRRATAPSPCWQPHLGPATGIVLWLTSPKRRQPSGGRWALGHAEPSVGHQPPLQVARCPWRGSSCLFQLPNCSSDPLEHQPNKFIASAQPSFSRSGLPAWGSGCGRDRASGSRNLQGQETLVVFGSLVCLCGPGSPKGTDMCLFSRCLLTPAMC